MQQKESKETNNQSRQEHTNNDNKRMPNREKQTVEKAMQNNGKPSAGSKQLHLRGEAEAAPRETSHQALNNCRGEAA